MTVQYANVIFDLDRAKALETVHGYLDDIGIHYCGRYGDWGYMWTDESFISGERAAEAALSAASSYAKTSVTQHAGSTLNEDRLKQKGVSVQPRPSVRHGKAPSELLEDHRSVCGSNVRLDGIDGRAPGVGLEPAVDHTGLTYLGLGSGRNPDRALDSSVGIDRGWRPHRTSTRFTRSKGEALRAIFSARGNVDFHCPRRCVPCSGRSAPWILPRG